MAITIKGGQEPDRNAPCPCRSGLKFKICHGDPQKRAVCEAVVRETMLRLIEQEKIKRGLIESEPEQESLIERP